MVGKISETSMPLCPYLRKLNGEGIRGPGLPCRTITSPLPVSGWPAYWCRAGLGSKVSTWLTPPHMNNEITLVARGAKCGFLGRNGVGIGDTRFARAGRQHTLLVEQPRQRQAA